MPTFRLSIDTRQLDRMLTSLGTSDVVAVIYNDAQSPEGTYFWKYVNDGRGPVRPIHAKVLHWVDPQTGEDVFAHYAGPAAPRHIRENALPAIRQGAVGVINQVPKGINREFAVKLVNGIANVAVAELQKQTSAKGPIAKGYRIEPAT